MLRLVATNAGAWPFDEIECPHCGYDLRGRLDATASAVASPCPECGAALDDVTLRLGSRAPAWWIETTDEGAKPIARAAVASALAAHHPRRFWSALRPGHVKRPARLVWMVAVAWAALAALVVAVRAVEAFERSNPALPFGARLQSALLSAMGGGDGTQFESIPILGGIPLLGPLFVTSTWGTALFESRAVLGTFVVAAALGSTLAFAWSPSQRVRTRRWPHVARALAVMLATAPAAAVAARLAYVWIRHASLPLLPLIAASVVLVTWLAVWWHSALSQYFRTRRPIVEACAFACAGVIAGVAGTSPWIVR